MLPLFMAIPLAGAAASVIIPWRWLRQTLFIILPILSIIAGSILYHTTTTQGPIGHSIGLYVGGVAIPFVADGFNALMIIATNVVTLSANIFAILSGDAKARFYPALALMLSAGSAGALLTADLFNLFVFIEVMLLPSYALMAMTGTWGRLAGGRTFVLTNLTASTLLLIGATFVYATAGTTNLGALAGAAHVNGSIQAALGIVLLAFVIKAAIFPVHTWLPRTYPSTSASVMTLFSGLHTKVAVYAIFRIFSVTFGLDQRWSWLIVVICVISICVGSFAGLAEATVRRILGYQMIGGMPLILITLAFGSQNVLAAAIFYMVHHMITMGALLLAAGAIEETYGTGKLVKLDGLARRDKFLAFIFAAASFSIVGFPPFSGMWGKLLLIMGIGEAGNGQAVVSIIAIIVGSFGAMLCMIRLWREVFWGKDMDCEGRIPLRLTWPAAAMLACSVAMFIFAGPLTDMMQHASSMLLDSPSYAHAILGDGEAIGLNLGDF
ncbi:MAG: monovalent cation/H+ antiporter subunit D family protein [Corynebacterium sp.]|nr:monovalent cation/H+ antiporter subunit D family protein [Corynebacterium sp.]